MARQQPSEEERAAEAERLIPSDTSAISTTNASPPANGRRLAVRTQPHRMGPEKPAAAAPESAEARAREDAAEAQLRRRMNICNNC
jgi:hypothetical protein